MVQRPRLCRSRDERPLLDLRSRFDPHLRSGARARTGLLHQKRGRRHELVRAKSYRRGSHERHHGYLFPGPDQRLGRGHGHQRLHCQLFDPLLRPHRPYHRRRQHLDAGDHHPNPLLIFLENGVAHPANRLRFPPAKRLVRYRRLLQDHRRRQHLGFQRHPRSQRGPEHQRFQLLFAGHRLRQRE